MSNGRWRGMAPQSDIEQVSRWLISVGAVLVLLGILCPWLSRLGLGRLPGDIHFERDGFHFFFPITTGLLISAILTLILWILRR